MQPYAYERHELVEPDWRRLPGWRDVTRDEWEVQFADVFDQINAYAARTPTNVVNPDVLAHARTNR